MPVNVVVDPELLEKAKASTGLREDSALVSEGLKALIARAAARRLIELGGSEPDLKAGRRRRVR